MDVTMCDWLKSINSYFPFAFLTSKCSRDNKFTNDKGAWVGYGVATFCISIVTPSKSIDKS
jgi:hypothetical protein